MAYTALLEEEGINAQYLAVLRPSRRVTSWTILSGSVYYNDFDYGYVYSVAMNGTELTAGSSTSLSAGQFYWDNDAERLYIRTPGSTAPNSTTDFVIVTYELYVGTFDAHWHRVPTDETTTVVYFDPLISDVPEMKSNVSDLLFGMLPVLSTSIRLINAEHFLEKHIYDGSFQNKEIRVYHWLDELSTSNVKLVQRGRMGEVGYSRGTVSIKVFDNLNIFEKEFRSTQDFFTVSSFANCDSAFIGKPIRTVYGVLDGHVPVNIDFVRDNATTSDNRDWIVRADGASVNDVTATVPASPVSTTTKTYVNSVVGFKVGDSVWIDKAADEYAFVTAVGANYIEHAALSVAATTGDTVKRSTVGSVDIIQNQTRYRAHYNRDYTVSVHASGALQFSFRTTLEANLSLPNTLSASDQVYCRVYGKKNTVTLGGNPFGSDSTTYGNLCSAKVILFDLLKTYAGLAESDINLTSFSGLTLTDEIGFAIPEKAQSSYPKMKDVLLRVLSSCLMRLYQDFDQKWKVSALGPITSASKDITDDEILKGSVDYSFEYGDVCSDFTVSYNHRETSETGNENYNLVRATNSIAKYLHGINKTFSHESAHIDSTGAQTLVNRLSYVLGDRLGVMSLSTKNRFFNNIVGDDISVTATKLPGFSYDAETENTRNFRIEQIDKSLRQVKIHLTDQKGIQDNSGSW